MVLNTPLLRVSRPVAACSRCRAAKVKCDGKLPACTACEKSNRASECSSTNDQFARGKERSYVATLEAKVDRIEKRIAEAKARRKSSTVLMLDCSASSSSTTATATATATPPGASDDTVQPSKPISKRAARRKEAFDMDNLVSDFGLLAVNATARDFYGFTTEMSYARLIQSASTKNPLPTVHSQALLPKYAVIPLVQSFLNSIFNLLPIFEEASLYASVDALYNDSCQATAWDCWSVRMVLAIACLSQSHYKADTHYANAIGHVTAALENAEQVLHPGYVSCIQALVLWTIYATLDPYHFDSWTLIGAASRAMVDLGLHQDPSRDRAMSKSKLELRRRVYWCVYSLDRVTSLVQTRAFSLSDEAADVAFPFHASSGSSEISSPQSQVFQQSFDSALDLFRIRNIQSEWYMDLFQSGREPWQEAYPYIWKQYARMSQWFHDISQSTLPAIKAFFKLELLYSYVYILSPSPRLPHMHEYAQRLIFEHCVSYATSILSHLDKPHSTTRPPITFNDAMRCYMTGRQFVDVLSRNMDTVLDPRPPIPPTASSSHMDSGDPLALPSQINPPPFPSPVFSDRQIPPPDPTTRTIDAINDFLSALSNLGLRFGYMHWHDRFQRESADVFAQLCQRRSVSPLSSPPVHEIPHPATTHPPRWIPIPPASPQSLQNTYHTLPTTPTGLFPQQPSPFSGSFSLTGHPFDAPRLSQSPNPPSISYDEASPPRHYPTMSHNGASPRPQQDWTTPSPQLMSDMPPPSCGHQTRASAYRADLPSSPNAVPMVPQDHSAWLQQPPSLLAFSSQVAQEQQPQNQEYHGQSQQDQQDQHQHHHALDVTTWNQSMPSQAPNTSS